MSKKWDRRAYCNRVDDACIGADSETEYAEEGGDWGVSLAIVAEADASVRSEASKHIKTER